MPRPFSLRTESVWDFSHDQKHTQLVAEIERTKSLLKAREGDVVLLRTPAGIQELEVLEIRYCEIITSEL